MIELKRVHLMFGAMLGLTVKADRLAVSLHSSILGATLSTYHAQQMILSLNCVADRTPP
jgi:hypothetical protein